MKKLFESAIIELETITPLFIKGKEIGYGEGMVRGRKDEKDHVYLIDNDKLCNYIAEKDKVEEYVTYFVRDEEQGYNPIDGFATFLNIQISESDWEKFIAIGNDRCDDKVSKNGVNRRINLNKFKSFLKRRNPSLRFKNDDYKRYKDLSLEYFLNRYKIFPKNEQLKTIAKGVTTIPKGKKFARNGLDKPFIPGSSIKGAIRNAVLWKIMSDSDKKQWLRSLNINRDISDNELIEKGFIISEGDFKGEYAYRWKETNKVLRDFFRIVKISDANFTEDVSLEDETTRAVCITGNKTYQKNFDIPLECAAVGTKAKFRITIDIEMAEKFFGEKIPYYLKNIGNLLETVNEFFKEVWASEESFFKGKLSIPHDDRGKKRVDTKKIYDFYSDETYYCYRYRWQFSKKDFASWVENFPQLSSISTPPHKIKDERYYFDIDALLNDEQNKSLLGEVFFDEIQKQKPNQYLFRTGWGGGMMSKAQFLHFESYQCQKVRNLVKNRRNEPAPKSRCLVLEKNNAEYPLGWCCLKILDENDLPGIDKVKVKTYNLGTSSGKKDDNDALKKELEKVTNPRASSQRTKAKSGYKKGDRIKKAKVKKEGNTYFVKIKGQEQPAALIGEVYMAKVVKVTVEEIIDGIVTKVKKV